MTIKCHEFFGCKRQECPFFSYEGEKQCWEVEVALTPFFAGTGERFIPYESKIFYCKHCLYYEYMPKIKKREITSQGSFIERRHHRRVPTPTGTMTSFKIDNSALNTIIVRDISLGGMLAADNNKREIYPINSLVNDIYINAPFCVLVPDTKSFLHIDKGKILRSYVDEASKNVCYGIEFLCVNSYIKEQIKSLVNTISPPIIN